MSRQFNDILRGVQEDHGGKPARSITMELKRRPSVDKSDKTVMDIHLNEPTQFARHIHQRIKLGLTIKARQRNVHVHGVEQD